MIVIVDRCQQCGAVLGDEEYEGTDEPGLCGVCSLDKQEKP